jgi:hypothetical protein
MRERSVLAGLLEPGDLILETGLAGISGLVKEVRPGSEAVAVTLDDRTTHALCVFEVCRIHRVESVGEFVSGIRRELSGEA